MAPCSPRQSTVPAARQPSCRSPATSPRELRRLITAGLEADVLLLCGGVSAGKFDLVPAALAELGVEEVFHKIALRPGKPLWFGVKDFGDRQVLVFGLPGNPVSTLVCHELFARPAIAALAGRGFVAPSHVTAKLSHDFQYKGGRASCLPAAIRSAATSQRSQTTRTIHCPPWKFCPGTARPTSRHWPVPTAWCGSAPIRSSSTAGAVGPGHVALIAGENRSVFHGKLTSISPPDWPHPTHKMVDNLGNFWREWRCIAGTSLDGRVSRRANSTVSWRTQSCAALEWTTSGASRPTGVPALTRGNCSGSSTTRGRRSLAHATLRGARPVPDTRSASSDVNLSRQLPQLRRESMLQISSLSSRLGPQFASSVLRILLAVRPALRAAALCLALVLSAGTRYAQATVDVEGNVLISDRRRRDFHGRQSVHNDGQRRHSRRWQFDQRRPRLKPNQLRRPA